MAEKMITAVQTIPSERLEDKEQILKDLELEKQRIKNLSIFSECKSIQGFPQSDMVYVINPVGLVNEFNKECGCNTDWKNGFGRGGLDKQNKYNEYIAKASKEYNIPCLILKSLIMQESSFDEKAANTQGFAGLTQVGGPAIGEAGFNIGNTNKINGVWIYDKTGDERFNPEKSIMGGAKVLGIKKDRLQKITFSLSEEEQWKYYLAGYNAGEGVVKDAYNELGKEGAKWEELIARHPWTSDKISILRKQISIDKRPVYIRSDEEWNKISSTTFYSPLLAALLYWKWGGESKYKEITEYVENIIKRKNQ